MEIKVGQQVFLKPVGNMVRKTSEIREAIVLKKGKKFFYVGSEGETQQRAMEKFYIEDLKQVSDYIPNWKIYFSKQDILDEEEFDKLRIELKEKFDSWGKLDLTLDQLRRMYSIMSE